LLSYTLDEKVVGKCRSKVSCTKQRQMKVKQKSMNSHSMHVQKC